MKLLIVALLLGCPARRVVAPVVVGAPLVGTYRLDWDDHAGHTDLDLRADGEFFKSRFTTAGQRDLYCSQQGTYTTFGYELTFTYSYNGCEDKTSEVTKARPFDDSMNLDDQHWDRDRNAALSASMVHTGSHERGQTAAVANATTPPSPPPEDPRLAKLRVIANHVAATAKGNDRIEDRIERGTSWTYRVPLDDDATYTYVVIVPRTVSHPSAFFHQGDQQEALAGSAIDDDYLLLGGHKHYDKILRGSEDHYWLSYTSDTDEPVVAMVFREPGGTIESRPRLYPKPLSPEMCRSLNQFACSGAHDVGACLAELEGSQLRLCKLIPCGADYYNCRLSPPAGDRWCDALAKKCIAEYQR